jgi:hypothetical protein
MDDGQHNPYRPSHRLSEYDKKRLDEMNRANLPAFWIGYVVVVLGGLWLLTQTPVLDWIGM